MRIEQGASVFDPILGPDVENRNPADHTLVHRHSGTGISKASG